LNLLSKLPKSYHAILALLIFAFALRGWDFGNPVLHVDEQFYLLVGDRLLHGSIPYLELWDRKPVGLFLIYAVISALPGGGIVGGQIVATMVAAITAWLVSRCARAIGVPSLASIGAGAAYLIWLSALGGEGGQSPVYYNLLIAAGALLTLKLPLLAHDKQVQAIWWNGLIACLLAGMAIQIKYTPVFEGAYFGFMHLIYLRRAGARRRFTLAAGAAWITAGIAPTLMSIAWFAWLGDAAFQAFWFANFESILRRPGYPVWELALRLLGIAAQLFPLLAAAAFAARRPEPGGEKFHESWYLLLGWVGAAIAGFLAIGTFFDHYALPVVAPLAVLSAAAFARHRAILIGALAIGIVGVAVEHLLRPNDRAGARAVARIVAANSEGRGCPYVFAGDTITYHMARACLPTRFAFPNHLTHVSERGATGASQSGEVARILATRPPVIVAPTRRQRLWNPRALQHLREALARDYRPIFATRRSKWETVVFLRRDLPVRP
jgi:hypothetical protein